MEELLETWGRIFIYICPTSFRRHEQMAMADQGLHAWPGQRTRRKQSGCQVEC
jgi:hypothetical protein